MQIGSPLYSPLEIEIWQRDRCRCVHCGKDGDVIHEIVPKSRRPKDWQVMENRVVLCITCHSWAHRFSCKVTAPILKADLERNLIRG